MVDDGSSESAKKAINNVIAAWVGQFQPNWVRRWIVRSYFSTGLLFRWQAYLFLRITRRIAKVLLPAEFFPTGGEFQQRRLAEDRFAEVKQKAWFKIHADNTA